MGRTLDQLDRRIQLERTRDTTRDELDRANIRLLPHRAQRAEARQASARFRAALAEVYRDPAQARRAFHARAEQVGTQAAAAEMARHPGRFGEMQGTQVGPIRSAERAAALRAAPKLETLATEHVRRVREAWSHRAEYRQERATVVQLERQLKTINHELGRSPGEPTSSNAWAGRSEDSNGRNGRLCYARYPSRNSGSLPLRPPSRARLPMSRDMNGRTGGESLSSGIASPYTI